MPAISVAPTRSNLIRVKKDLRFAREGYEILDRKREVLTAELVRVAHAARHTSCVRKPLPERCNSCSSPAGAATCGCPLSRFAIVAEYDAQRDGTRVALSDGRLARDLQWGALDRCRPAW